MKSLRYLFPVLLIFVSLFISCNKEDDPAKPTASFTTTKADYNTGEAIVFTNTSADATAFVWSFGDATTSTEKSPTKTYNTAGVYTVTMPATRSMNLDWSPPLMKINFALATESSLLLSLKSDFLNITP